MLHITFEIIENHEGLYIKGTRKYGNGESLAHKRFTATELEKLEINQNRLINDVTLDMLTDFTKDDNK